MHLNDLLRMCCLYIGYFIRIFGISTVLFIAANCIINIQQFASRGNTFHHQRSFVETSEKNEKQTGARNRSDGRNVAPEVLSGLPCCKILSWCVMPMSAGQGCTVLSSALTRTVLQCTVAACTAMHCIGLYCCAL